MQRHSTFGLADVLDKELGRLYVSPTPSSETTARMAAARSPSPVPAHLQGFGFKAMNADGRPVASTSSGAPPAVGVPPRPKNRDRSFSPDGRGKRPRGGYRERERSPLPPPRVPRYGEPDRGRGGRRYDSPPPREDPYAWFPEALRFFLGVLPNSGAFDGMFLCPGP